MCFPHPIISPPVPTLNPLLSKGPQCIRPCSDFKDYWFPGVCSVPLYICKHIHAFMFLCDLHSTSCRRTFVWVEKPASLTSQYHNVIHSLCWSSTAHYCLVLRVKMMSISIIKVTGSQSVWQFVHLPALKLILSAGYRIIWTKTINGETFSNEMLNH